MSRRRMIRNIVTEIERWRISLLAGYGFTYRAIAKRLYGTNCSETEERRVGNIARQEGVSPWDWRRCESSDAQRVATEASGNVPASMKTIAQRSSLVLKRKKVRHSKAG